MLKILERRILPDMCPKCYNERKGIAVNRPLVLLHLTTIQDETGFDFFGRLTKLLRS